jgi:acetyl esterase/lipase
MDAEVAAVLQAALEKNGPPPTPQIGDVQTRRVTLDAMLEYFNNHAQPLADDVKITDHEVTTADGAALVARWYRRSASDTGAAVLYLHGTSDRALSVTACCALGGPCARAYASF